MITKNVKTIDENHPLGQGNTNALEKLDKGDYPKTSWTNGKYSISWLYDEVVICDNESEKYSVIQGGDFESILSGLLSINPRKKEDLY